MAFNSSNGSQRYKRKKTSPVFPSKKLKQKANKLEIGKQVLLESFRIYASNNLEGLETNRVLGIKLMEITRRHLASLGCTSENLVSSMQAAYHFEFAHILSDMFKVQSSGKLWALVIIL